MWHALVWRPGATLPCRDNRIQRQEQRAAASDEPQTWTTTNETRRYGIYALLKHRLQRFIWGLVFVSASDAQQFDLFAQEPPARTAAPIISGELSRLASRLAAYPLYLGTCSWSFPGWDGLVYRGRQDKTLLSQEGLKVYSQHPLLRTVSIDRSYYGPLTRDELARYAGQVPRHFRFIVKAHREITTPVCQLPAAARRSGVDRFLDADYTLRSMVQPLLEGIGERNACLLLQFPPLAPRQRRDPDAFIARLHEFVGQLPDELPYAIELRNPQLYRSSYAAALKDTGALHCFTVHPRAPTIAEQREVLGDAWGDVLMVRWNLRRDQQYQQAKDSFAPFNQLAAPDPDTRAALAALCAQALTAGKPAFVVANNKAEGSAPRTIFALAESIAAALAADPQRGAVP